MNKRLTILITLLFVSVGMYAFAGPEFHGGGGIGPESLGSAITGRAITATLYVSPDGAGTDCMTWPTACTTIQAALNAARPFKIVATIAEANAGEKFRLRLSADSGLTWFDDIFIEGELAVSKRQASVAPPSTDHIFNKGAQIVGQAKSESGSNSLVAWLELQEI